MQVLLLIYFCELSIPAQCLPYCLSWLSPEKNFKVELTEDWNILFLVYLLERAYRNKKSILINIEEKFSDDER